ncbi:MAG: hypothetical protein DRJ05_04990 [Bacteroidetes bacterium]|nr:MAG: hypothetical protein DRJ05_04990 [Bacteroidota bacterium]
MFKQFIHTVFKAESKEVTQITSDIKSFYKNIEENSASCMADGRYFNNLITAKYWGCLNLKKGLSNREQDFLQQGILSMLLFLSFHFLENKGGPIGSHTIEIYKSIMYFRSPNQESMKLHHLTMNAITLVEKKKHGRFNQETNSEIYKSITWTLQNIILADATC